MEIIVNRKFIYFNECMFTNYSENEQKIETDPIYKIKNLILIIIVK